MVNYQICDGSNVSRETMLVVEPAETTKSITFRMFHVKHCDNQLWWFRKALNHRQMGSASA